MLEKKDIATSAAAAVFASMRQRRILLTLIDREQSLSDLMAATGLPLNLLHYHVRKMIRLGLVEITAQRKRAGAPITLYRARAKVFFVPAALSPALPGAEMSAKLHATLERSLAGTVKGTAYFHDGGGPRMVPVYHEARGRMTGAYWVELRLADSDAQRLATELGDILKRFRKRAGKGPRYLIHTAMAPLQNS